MPPVTEPVPEVGVVFKGLHEKELVAVEHVLPLPGRVVQVEGLSVGHQDLAQGVYHT